MADDPQRKLSDREVQGLQPAGWWRDEGALCREFTFGSYPEGVDFAVRVATLAEQQRHHPDIHLFYKRVRLHYLTHDVGGITQADLVGARAVNDLFNLVGKPADGAES